MAIAKHLVVILLRGAADGLSIVIPYDDDAYYRARPSIAIAPPGQPDGGLALDEHFALHPALADLMPLWQAKQLAFVHAAGPPTWTHSHFDAQLLVEHGVPGIGARADGWMNRLLAALPGWQDDKPSPIRAVAIGPTLPRILAGRMAATNLQLGPTAARRMPIDRPATARHFDRLYGGDDAICRSYREGREARAELITSLEIADHHADEDAARPAGFAGQMAYLGSLLNCDPRITLAFLGLHGWDTHVRQGAHLAKRLGDLGAGLAILARRLGAQWQSTVVVVLSEFGRTVQENATGGTDHGHGTVVTLLGGAIDGGRVSGEWPGLAPTSLHEGRDLAATTDYRHVVASVLRQHLALPAEGLEHVFPGLAPGNVGLGLIRGAAGQNLAIPRTFPPR